MDRMVEEAERFADEDSAHRQRIEALNGLSSYVYGLKSQLKDQEGLGGKISGKDKNLVLEVVKETEMWLDDNEKTAELEEFEEKMSGKHLKLKKTDCA